MSSEGSDETARGSASLIFLRFFTYAIMLYQPYSMHAPVSIELGFKSLISSQRLQFL